MEQVDIGTDAHVWDFGGLYAHGPTSIKVRLPGCSDGVTTGLPVIVHSISPFPTHWMGRSGEHQSTRT